MSANGGRNVLNLSRDNKPNEEGEAYRIIHAGGKIYQTQTVVPKLDGTGNEVILGPHRVFPGRLSVSRSFGDIEAKLPRYGGNMDVIVADPEIRQFKITGEMDYVILACDGIFDKASSLEVLQCVWEGVLEDKGANVHDQCGRAVDRILKMSVAKKTMDNITVVFIAFDAFNTRGFTKGVPHTLGKASSTGSSADLEIDEKEKKEEPVIHPIFSKTQNSDVLFVVDDEDMKETHFPKRCISDYNYVNDGRCPTPPYLKDKHKRFKFDCPTIVTTNPDELPGIE